jgi:magnesium transporter
MLFAYRLVDRRLERMGPSADLRDAIWVDPYRPQPEQVAKVREQLGIEVPSLADMEEIEISNRLYRENGNDFMTVILPGQLPDGSQVSGPVTFVLTSERLVTVRHHAPRPLKPFRRVRTGPLPVASRI